MPVTHVNDVTVSYFVYNSGIPLTNHVDPELMSPVSVAEEGR